MITIYSLYDYYNYIEIEKNVINSDQNSVYQKLK